MTILLKNLFARTPNTQDLPALAELVRLCEDSEDTTASDTLEEMLSEGQQPNFHLTDDAWVIVTTRGQLVGFACIKHEECTRLTTFLCVHPHYRKRGIGTLLLRMVEVRARQYTHQAGSGQPVVLLSLLNKTNVGAQRLFEREGYQAGRPFLRISCVLNEVEGKQQVSLAPRKFTVDVGLDARNQPPVIASLNEQDALCNVYMYRIYEKELRSTIVRAQHAPAELQALGV